MKSCKAVSEMLGGGSQINAKSLLQEVHAEEEGLEARVEVKLVTRQLRLPLRR